MSMDYAELSSRRVIFPSKTYVCSRSKLFITDEGYFRSYDLKNTVKSVDFATIVFKASQTRSRSRC